MEKQGFFFNTEKLQLGIQTHTSAHTTEKKAQNNRFALIMSYLILGE